MKNIFFLLGAILSLSVSAQDRSSSFEGIVSYGEEEARFIKKGDVYIKTVECTAYCASDLNADNKIVEQAVGKSKRESDAIDFATFNCKEKLVRMCPKKSSSLKENNDKTDLDKVSDFINKKYENKNCSWVEGDNKVRGNLINRKCSSKSAFCAGRLLCGDTEPRSIEVMCMAIDNDTCPSADSCLKGEVYLKDKFSSEDLTVKRKVINE
jgi:hypothetical protein